MSTAPVTPAKPDLDGALLNIEGGLYAITHMIREAFHDPVEADGARHGVHYVALRLERDLRAVIAPLAGAGPAKGGAA